MNQPTAYTTKSPRLLASRPKIRPVARHSVPVIGLDPLDSAGRAALEACIADTFARHYKATIEHFLPFLLSLRLCDQLGAVVGLRLAAESPLFLEQYLGRPVEQAVAGAFNTPVDRGQIVEIGNLASVVPGSAALLFGLLPILLQRAGIRWVVCTATPQVQSMLDKLEFPTRRVCRADADVLGDRKAGWGSYYDSCPEVIVGDVENAVACAMSNKRIAQLTAALAAPISDIAASLSGGS